MEVFTMKIKELASLNDELDSKKTKYVDEIRKIEN